MLKTTALTLGLTMMAGSAVAASGTAGPTSAAPASQNGLQAGGTGSEAALKAEFHRLDTNNDGVLSPAEAKADPKVASLYNSMANNLSIKSDPYAKKSDEAIGGITLNQFVAGMEAASGGAAGPAVSGGQTYILMRNGTKRPVSQTAGGATPAQSMGNGMRQQPMNSAGSTMGANGSRVPNGSGSTMSGQSGHMSQGNGMQNHMQNGTMQNRMQSHTTPMQGSNQNQMPPMQGQMQNRSKQMGGPAPNNIPPQPDNGTMGSSEHVPGQSSMPMGTSD